jgi:hypothetical protein
MKQVFEFLKSPQNIIKYSPIKAPKVKANVSGTLALIGYLTLFILMVNWLTNIWPRWTFEEKPILFNPIEKSTAIDSILETMKNDLGIHSEVFFGKVKGEEGIEVYLEKSYGNEASEVYQIASLSKSLIGISFISLQDEGYLSLEDPACKYIEVFCKLSLERVRIIDLLRHRSGLAPVPLEPLKFIRFLSSTFSPWRLQELHKIIPSSLEVSPDKKYNYNNLNYIVLSMILAALEIDEESSALYKNPKKNSELTNERFIANFYKSLNIAGLNLHQDSMRRYKEMNSPFTKLDSSRVPGYSSIIFFNSAFRIPIYYFALDYHKSYGAGGLAASVKDLFFLLRDLIRKKPRYLKLIEDNSKDGYSLGFIVSELDEGRTVIWHNGQSRGYRSLMMIDIERSEIFVWLANSWMDQEQQATLAKSLRQILAEKPYFVPKK